MNIVKALTKHEDRNTHEHRTILHSWIVTVERWCKTDEELLTQRFVEVVEERLAAARYVPACMVMRTLI